MIQSVQDGSEVSLSQKEKNEKLQEQIEEFENKNREIKSKVNNAMLLKMGELEINKIQPLSRDVDKTEQLQHQL